jgi:hypothetical protein
MILGFRHDADEICTVLGYYTASNGNPLLTFQDSVSVPSSRGKKPKKNDLDSLTLEDGTSMLSRNVCKRLPFHAV